MSIKKIAENTWQVDVVVKFIHNSQKMVLRERPIVKGTIRKAQQIEKDVHRALHNKREELLSTSRTLKMNTFGDCLTHYLSKKQGLWADCRVQKLRDNIGHVPLSELTEKFDRWFDLYRQESTVKGTAPKTATCNRVLQLAKAATNHCFQLEYIDRDPLKIFKKQPENNKRTVTISDLEFAQIQKILPDWLKPISKFAYIIPTRRGELEKARKEHIDWNNHLLFIPAENTKGGHSQREVPIPDSMIEYFKSIPEDCPWIFFRKDQYGNYHQLGDFHNTWRKSCEKLGIKDFHFHDLRGVSSTRLESSSAPIPLIDYIGGWSSGSMRERYRRRFTPESLHRAIGNKVWIGCQLGVSEEVELLKTA